MTILDSSRVTLSANAAVGSTVNQYLFELGITRTKFAEVLGISQPVASKKLRGQVGWNAEDIATAAAYLGIGTEDIMPTLKIIDGEKSWIPAPFKPGYAKSPASARDFNESRLWESNPRPSHYE